MYESSHELLNVLRPRILENYEKSRKSQNIIELFLSAQSSFKNEIHQY